MATFGHLEGDVAAVAHHLGPILISFSLSVVSDQSLISSGANSEDLSTAVMIKLFGCYMALSQSTRSEFCN
jgi:hypothetical protein